MAGKEETLEEKLNRFDEEAAAWDAMPFIADWTALAAAKLPEALGLKGEEHLLELGAGTGLLTVQVAKKVASVVAVDNSEGMMREFWRKAEGVENMAGVCRMLTGPGQLEAEEGRKDGRSEGGFDVILANLTFHHISEPVETLVALRAYGKAGALIAILDYAGGDEKGRQFHEAAGHADVSYHGFSQGQLQALLLEAGYEQAEEKILFGLEKQNEGGVAHYDAVLATARVPK